MDPTWYLLGLATGMGSGIAVGSGRYSSGYEHGQEALYDSIQKLCEERNIVLTGRDSINGRNIEYKINELLDQAREQSKQ